METLIVVNPTAGGGRAAALWGRCGDEAARLLGAQVVMTERSGHARELAREAGAAGCRRIVVVGGDGTLHEVVNGVPLSRVEVAIVPVGTGNDFARCAGVPRDPRRALLGLAGGWVRRLDLGRIGDEYYLHVAGAGFDAEVAARVNAGPRRGGGALPYLAATLATLRRFRAADYRIELDGRVLEQRCALIAAGNAPAYAGGMRICPGALMDDGLLQVCIVGDLSAAALLALLPAVFRGAHLRHPRVSCQPVRHLRLAGPPDVRVHADGEPVGGLPVDFGVAAGALALWMPRGSTGHPKPTDAA